MPPTLRGPRGTLRAFETGDAAARVALGIRPAIVRAFGGDTPTPGATLTVADAAAWLERESALPSNWAIEHDGRFIGTVRLHSLDAHDGRAAMAIGILDESLLGRGLGSEAIRLVVGHAFDE